MFQNVSEKLLGIVPWKIQGNGSEELFSGNSQEFPHFLRFLQDPFSKKIKNLNYHFYHNCKNLLHSAKC